MHEKSCFVTLTYNNEHLPSDGSLDVEHVQEFMRKLRAKYSFIEYRCNCKSKKGRKKTLWYNPIRFFGCGEYGEEKGKRPHYHIALFGIDFDDKELAPVKQSEEYPLYISKQLQSIWTKGFSTLGELNEKSAGYVARYTVKKLTGAKVIKKFIPQTGDVAILQPEFGIMSRRKGIGNTWYEKYKKDCLKDFLVWEGQTYPVPKYYREMVKTDFPEIERSNSIERKRHLKEQKELGEMDFRRMDTKQKILKQKIKRLERTIHNDN